MKKSKMIILIIIMGLAFSCKKQENLNLAESAATNSKSVVSKNSPNTTPFGQCLSNKANRIRDWIGTYGAGGTQENDAAGSMNELSNIAYESYECKKNGGSGGTSPIKPTIPIFDASGVNDIYEFLQFLGAGSVCSNPHTFLSKSKVIILNEIIGRVVNSPIASYYYSSNNDVKLTLLLNSFYSNESYLFDDDGFTLIYLNIVVERNFDIPNILAIVLFNKDPLYNGPDFENGQYFDWGGFKIDGYKNDLALYCSTPKIYLPNPLPNIIYYAINYPNDVNPTINQSTSIFLVEGAYVTSNFPVYSYVPNGYYKHPEDSNNHNYYHIVNGNITEIVQAIIDPNAPSPVP